jgi:molybdenum cofactor guanylyltransferase
MGRDKALLPVSGGTLIGQVASRVRAAAGTACIIGPPERYENLGFPVVADLIPDCGPLGGLYTALKTSSSDWILMVACDMPAVTVELLTRLIQAAPACGRLALVPQTDAGWEPLCAVYHQSLLPLVTRALDHKLLKMQDFISKIGAAAWLAPDPSVFANVNTPQEWEAHR